MDKTTTNGSVIKCRFLSTTICISLLLLATLSNAQSYYFEKNQDIIVRNQEGERLAIPWSGGFNACQFGLLDMNGDGEKDLVVFDKSGNQLSCYLYDPSNANFPYRQAPEYQRFFPLIKDWMMLVDFNGDGKEDIFTFNEVAGIRVYKNISDAEGLKFVLYENAIKAKLFKTYETLYCPSIEFPAVADMDGDGDLDILSFWVPTVGNFLHYYRNMSVEKFGHSDSLIFEIADWSWGCFLEDNQSNVIILDTCAAMDEEKLMSIPKHTGSSVTALDIDNNGVMDLLLSDFGYPNVVMLYNGGTAQQARISEVDMNFPATSEAISIFASPTVQLLDVDRDGKQEILVSSFSSSPFNMDGLNSIWLYQNQSSAGTDFQLMQKDFLQEHTIDVGLGAFPALFDYNRDGRLDLVVGNYGVRDSAYEELGEWKTISSARLSLFENIGSDSLPEFQLIDNDYASLSKYGFTYAVPTFGDIDGDGKQELLIGSEAGNLFLFRDISEPNEVAFFELIDSNFQEINVGKFAAPQLFDLDDDGLLDLVVGEQRTVWRNTPSGTIVKGNINFYKNIGSKTQPVFTFVTDSLGGVDVTNHDVSVSGYAVPHFFRTKDGKTLLFCGQEDGHILYYSDIDNNLDGSFTFQQKLLHKAQNQPQTIREGVHTALCLHDFNGDGYPEMIVGNHRGGLSYYQGIEPKNMTNAKMPELRQNSVNIYPNPSNSKICLQTNEKLSQIQLYSLSGQLLQKTNASVEKDDTFCLDISAFPAGVYLLKAIASDGRVFVFKWIRS